MSNQNEAGPPTSSRRFLLASLKQALGHSEVRLLISLAVCALGIVLFIHLASEMQEGETLSIDRTILLAMRSPII